MDEAVYLYQISNTISRENNYDKLLSIFNHIVQGKAEYLGIIVGGVTKFLDDPKRGLFTNSAWQRRTKKSRFIKQIGIQDTSGVIIRLTPLTATEILTLLQRLTEIHALNLNYQQTLTTNDSQEFVQEIVNRLGAMHY